MLQYCIWKNHKSHETTGDVWLEVTVPQLAKTKRTLQPYTATTVKHSGGSVKIWICLAGLCSTLQSFTWPWTPLYTKVFESQVKPSLQNWVMQQNSDPKHSSIAMVGL